MTQFIILFAGCTLFLVSLPLPFLLARLERVRKTDCSPPAHFRTAIPDTSHIEVVIAAYKESSVIGQTIRALNASLIPPGIRLTTRVVASDAETFMASTGATYRHIASRGGKAAAINLGIRASDADVVVLTDANCEIAPADWVARTLRALRNADLVSGDKAEQGSRENLFWRFESTVKKKTADMGTLSVVGEFLAFRRTDFRDVPVQITSDDLWIAMDFHRRGLVTAIAPGIKTLEEPAQPRDQWERRVRIAYGQLTEALPRVGELTRTPTGRHYLAHKLYRLTIGAMGFWLAVLAAASLWAPVSTIFVFGIIAFAAGAYAGLIRVPRRAHQMLAPIAMQVIPVAASIRALKRRRSGPSVGWEKVSR